MKTIRLHPTRRRVYELLVDGAAPGAGLAPSSIIDLMNKEGKISKQRVYQIIRELAKDGFVRPIEGSSLYTRGRNAGLLDDLIREGVNTGVNTSIGGGPNVEYPSKEDNNGPKTQILETFVPTAEAHVNGRYIYPVLRVGELYEPFRVRDPDTGEISECVVWDPEPTRLKGVTYYTGRVPIHGGMTIQYWQGAVERSLHVWPTPVALLPGHVHEAEGDLAAKAQDAANWLGRYGGWRLGVPRFSSNEDGPGIHYACNDPAVVGNVPEGIKGFITADTWIDSTPPPRAVETTDAERMDAMINFAAITKDLKQSQQAIRQDLAKAIEDRERQVLQLRYDALGRQAEIWQTLIDLSDAQLRAIHAQHIQAHIGGPGPGPSDPATASTTDADPDARKGGMYQ